MNMTVNLCGQVCISCDHICLLSIDDMEPPLKKSPIAKKEKGMWEE